MVLASQTHHQMANIKPTPMAGLIDQTMDLLPKKKRSANSGKRDKLQKHPSLDKVDEDHETEKKEEAKFGCSDYFGVKSYLHHFYESRSTFKDPSIYEEDEDMHFLLRGSQRRRRCTSVWWRVFVWIGANFLLFGIIGVLVGYLVPQRPIIMGKIADDIEILDREAVSFNFNLDVCKLVGLVLFCIGGLTLTAALLFPSFLYPYCDDERRDGSIKVSLTEEKPLKSPIEMTIPATPSITEVQPGRKAQEAIFTQEGMLPYKD